MTPPGADRRRLSAGGVSSPAANPVVLAQSGRHLQAPRGGVLERAGVPDARGSGSHLLVVLPPPRPSQNERPHPVGWVGCLKRWGIFVESFMFELEFLVVTIVRNIRIF
jgi:hypothetical protein